MYTFAVKPDVLLTGNECNVGTNVPLLTGSFLKKFVLLYSNCYIVAVSHLTLMSKLYV